MDNYCKVRRSKRRKATMRAKAREKRIRMACQALRWDLWYNEHGARNTTGQHHRWDEAWRHQMRELSYEEESVA